jgi:putative acyl-CoA dehydrogenase
MTEAMARAMQASELLRHSSGEVVELFLATRLGGDQAGWGSSFGTFGLGARQHAAKAVVERARIA